MTRKVSSPKHLHILFVDNSPESKEAEKMIKKVVTDNQNLSLSIVHVEQGPEFPVLPHVVSSAGDFRGFDAVKRFAISPLCA